MYNDVKAYEKILISLAESVASRVDGVAYVGIPAKGLFGRPKRKRGVSIELLDNKLVYHLSICIDNGHIVKDIAYEIQQRVKKEVEAATNFKVKRVNVNIVDVDTGDNLAYKR